jgi:hypothetical protein
LEVGFRDDPFGLSFLFPYRPSDGTARTKILDRPPCRNCQQLDRLCHWIENVTAWLYSSEHVLHLRIRVQHAALAQGTNAQNEIGRSSANHWSHLFMIVRLKKGYCVTNTALKLVSATKIGLPE